jgi:hypothetical protein
VNVDHWLFRHIGLVVVVTTTVLLIGLLLLSGLEANQQATADELNVRRIEQNHTLLCDIAAELGVRNPSC